VPIFCGYVFLLTSVIKIMIATGVLLDRRKGHSKVWTTLATIVSIVFLAVMIGGTIAPTRGVRVYHEQMCFENLPEGFDGARIGFFSDMHLGSLTTPRKTISEVVSKFNTEECIMVISGGDIINIRPSEVTPQRAEMLRAITAPVYSVVGNHDLGYYRRDTLDYTVAQSTADFKAAIDSLGWTRLDNSSVWIHRGGDSLRLTGIEFSRRAADNRHKRTVGGVNIDSLMHADVPQGAFSIVVSHIPQYWHSLTATHGADLTLSGHTHAMQCKFRLGGRTLSPAGLLYDEWAGTYHNNNKTLYISEGVGFAGIPIRLGVPPSITIITLRKCE
jgi:predicted MPP superfamily phosphohydrolase